MSPGDVVLFDGLCGLCARTVRFILAHERDGELRFAPLESGAGREFLARAGVDPATQTIVVVGAAGVRLRSAATFAIAAHLRAPWRWLVVARVLPRRLTDAAYDVIARNRARWFGRLERCDLLTPETAARFLS